MFEAAERIAAAAAQRRAEALREEIAARLAGALPRGIAVAVDADGISLTGRALRLRLARDASLGRVIAGATR